ncbi:hypothetical protein V8E51_015256 [Hyaloscypha variabilis]
MDWNGAEVRAQSAVRWPSNADAGGKQTPVGWLLDRVFQTATSSIEAGAPGALRQIRVLAAFACGYDTWTAGYQIATLESRHSSSNLSSLQTVHNLACQFFLGQRTCKRLFWERSSNPLHMHMRAPVAFGPGPHRETSGLDPERERSPHQPNTGGSASRYSALSATNLLLWPASAEETCFQDQDSSARDAKQRGEQEPLGRATPLIGYINRRQ